jgi:hypothetical protein
MMRTNVQRLGEPVTAPLLGRLTPCAGRQRMTRVGSQRVSWLGDLVEEGPDLVDSVGDLVQCRRHRGAERWASLLRVLATVTSSQVAHPAQAEQADYALAVDGGFAAAGRSRTARSGAVSPPLSFPGISIASHTAPPARNLRMVPPTAAPRGLRSRPFAGREKPRAGTLGLSRMPEPVVDGLKPPSNGGVQAAGLLWQVAGPMNFAVGSVAGYFDYPL